MDSFYSVAYNPLLPLFILSQIRPLRTLQTDFCGFLMSSHHFEYFLSGTKRYSGLILYFPYLMPKISLFFFFFFLFGWSVVFSNHEQDTRCAPCHWHGIASRLTQQKELGNTYVYTLTYMWIHTHTYVCLYTYLFLCINFWVHANTSNSNAVSQVNSSFHPFYICNFFLWHLQICKSSHYPQYICFFAHSLICNQYCQPPLGPGLQAPQAL